MTLHAIMGDGLMKTKELEAALDDIWKADEDADEAFWFVIQGKSDPSDTDKDLCKWFAKNDVFYAVITDDPDALDNCYNPAQTFKAKSLSRKLINVLESEPEEGEGTDVLALFVSDDVDAEEDRWLNDLCGELTEAGHKIRALNDGLLELDFTKTEDTEDDQDDQGEDEGEDEKPKPSKKPSKKTAAQEKATATTKGEVDIPETREELEELNLPQLKEIAAAKGIELPPRTRSTTYVDAILGEYDPNPEPPEAEIAEDEDKVEPPAEAPAASLNGIDMDEMIDLVAEQVVQKLVKALRDL